MSLAAVGPMFSTERDQRDALVHNLALVVAGGCANLAFAPMDLHALAPVTLALLFLGWQQVPPATAAWRGGLFGLGCFGPGLYWILVALVGPGHVPWPVAGLLTGGLVLFCILAPVLTGYLVARIAVPCAPPCWAVACAAAWTLSEWLRGWVAGGFPWLTVGYSQIDAPPAALAPWTGVYGVSFVTALSAAFLAVGIRRSRRPGPLLLYVAAAAATWSFPLLIDRPEPLRPAGPPVRAAVIQGNTAQALKWQPETLLAIQDRYAEIIEAQAANHDLLVLPETAIPEYRNRIDDFLRYVDEYAKETRTGVLLGLPVKRGKADYNALIGLGTARGQYLKRRLVPIGEYTPWKHWLPDIPNPLQTRLTDLSPGPRAQPPLYMGNLALGLSICFEIAYPDEVGESIPEAGILVNVSNDAWFSGTLAPHQHLQMARMRAREFGRPLLRATNSGIAAVIDENGTVVARTRTGISDVVSATTTPFTGTTPYAQYGMGCVLLLVATSGLLAGFVYRLSAKFLDA